MDFLCQIVAMIWVAFFKDSEGVLTLLPLAGYIFLGLGNIFFFSQAMNKIPASVALAVWMSVCLLGVKLVDTFVFRQPYTVVQLFYFALILIAIIGLKNSVR